MIFSPVYYYRESRHEISAFCRKLQRIQGFLSSVIPIISYCLPNRTPLSIALGGLRSIVHLQTIVEGIKQRDLSKVSIASIQLLINLTATALVISTLLTPYFNPSIGFLLWGADDIIGNILEMIKGMKQRDEKQVFESLAYFISTMLYIYFITLGHIEILASCMLLQIILNLHKAMDAFRKGHYIEGACYLATAGLTTRQLVPQMEMIEWKWRANPTLEGELIRDKRGFVYLKVKDEIIYELNELFGDSSSPPYFGNGKYGAHITCIPVGELGKDVHISKIGQTIKFTIAFCDPVKPDGFKGDSSVSFLSVCAPELDALKSKYGLTPKGNGTHDFHIT